MSPEGLEPTNRSHWRERERWGRLRLSGTKRGLYTVPLEGSTGEVTLKRVAAQRAHAQVDQGVDQWVNG